MPHEYCPCGLVLYRSSTVRPLKTPCLRLFMSIRTMKTVTPEIKICNACRTAYYDWKSRYPEFGNIFRRIEEELAEPDVILKTESNDEMETIQEDETVTLDQVVRATATKEAITLHMNCTISSHKSRFGALKKNILIPEGARCCPSHITDRRLTIAAINYLSPSTIQYKQFSSADVQLLLSKWQHVFQKRKHLDFDDPLLLSDDDYKALISLSKDQFNDLISHISKYDIRNSSNRFIRTVIALLLSKLRMELSNKLLATLFQLTDAKTVARTLKSGHNALMNTFVSYNLGLDHIARQKIIDQHTSTITRELMCDGERDKAGTRSIRCRQFVTRTIRCNDDIVVVDRDFRDSISTMEELGLNAALPPFLNGRRQFTTAEANESRCVTKIRWIVETVNGRLKQFKFLSNTVQNFSIPHLEEYLSIACSIINRYQTPIKTSSLEDIEITKKNGRFAQSVKEFRNVSREK
ncbi:unnamed protein product [Rotaria magnacalcarata]|uniref:DDE Tnp4 domain-containing protein n=2 Tax=Rotaria magnacalcarata TaxID=392030 RepID=A0A815LLZ7_9BILA|nr:unnamed protein product [Rotaria magnacalcarata]CAF3936253.1 unnamed protein product [Rotaria magnacalcarata]